MSCHLMQKFRNFAEFCISVSARSHCKLMPWPTHQSWNLKSWDGKNFVHQTEWVSDGESEMVWVESVESVLVFPRYFQRNQFAGDKGSQSRPRQVGGRASAGPGLARVSPSLGLDWTGHAATYRTDGPDWLGRPRYLGLWERERRDISRHTGLSQTVETKHSNN